MTPPTHSLHVGHALHLAASLPHRASRLASAHPGASHPARLVAGPMVALAPAVEATQAHPLVAVAVVEVAAAARGTPVHRHRALVMPEVATRARLHQGATTDGAMVAVVVGRGLVDGPLVALRTMAQASVVDRVAMAMHVATMALHHLVTCAARPMPTATEDHHLLDHTLMAVTRALVEAVAVAQVVGPVPMMIGGEVVRACEAPVCAAVAAAPAHAGTLLVNAAAIAIDARAAPAVVVEAAAVGVGTTVAVTGTGSRHTEAARAAAAGARGAETRTAEAAAAIDRDQGEISVMCVRMCIVGC